MLLPEQTIRKGDGAEPVNPPRCSALWEGAYMHAARITQHLPRNLFRVLIHVSDARGISAHLHRGPGPEGQGEA